MRIKLSKYRNAEKEIKSLYKLQKPKKVEPWVSMYAACNGVPVVVVTWYVGEVIGFTDEINGIIEHLIKDYSYEGIEE